jgi:hypothetical protein
VSPVSKALFTQGLVGGLSSGGGMSFIVWFSVIIAFSLIFKGTVNYTVTGVDKAVCFIFMLICLLPSALICWCSLSLLCLYLSYRRRENTVLQAGFILLAVVAIRIPLIQFCMSVFSSALLGIDAFFVAQLLSIFMDTVSFNGNIVYTKNEYSLAIMTGCSSFDNMSLALLLWLTLVCTHCSLGLKKRFTHAFILAVIIIFTNTVRLSLMAWQENFYEFFHANSGLMLIEITLLMTAVIMALYSNKNTGGRLC